MWLLDTNVCIYLIKKRPEAVLRRLRAVASAAAYGRLRADLERLGTPIGSMDLLIAAQALAHGHTVVTNNTRAFSRVSGLKVENWAER